MPYINYQFLAIIGGAAFVGITLLTALFLRRVVSTNEVHIIQTGRKTVSYGSGLPSGNIYYEWPSWVPLIGITKVKLPVSVFYISLKDYEAYDVGRVPFVVDIMAFFRIEDSNLAAQRVAHFEELQAQLTNIVKGAIRTILAKEDIDHIMVERSKFGASFTEEVKEQLKEWGVITVKNIELMDIRDAPQNEVVHNIMAKKKSLIENQSRQEVAKNMKEANIAEISAQQETESAKQNALLIVGQRTAEKDKQIGIAGEQAKQSIRDQEKITAEKQMAVQRVNDVQKADIEKNVKIVNAEQEKQTLILVAEGKLTQQQREAEAIIAVGEAKGRADQAILMAPVNAQLTLAEKIGANKDYQQYLITIKQVDANQAVGIEQAKALEKADIKIITNSGNPPTGMKSVMDLFNSQGGQQVGAMLEGFAQTEEGAALLNRLTPPRPTTNGNGKQA